MKQVFLICVLLLGAAGTSAAAPKKIRVLLWSEQTEPRDVYPSGINGALAEYLRQFPDIEVKTAGLADPGAGLDESVLAQTDVLIWFDHRKRGAVPDEAVARIVNHVRERGMGFIGLHSAHHSKPLKKLLDATGSWGSYVDHGKPEQMWIVLPRHPIAEGVSDFTIPQTEIYTEPFEVPQPQAVIVEGTWESGHRSREVMTWAVGKGRVVYIRAGHETYPIYFMPKMRRLVSNSVRYSAGRTEAPKNLKRREAGPPATAQGPYRNR
jgi:trehalose utilization protein